MFPALATNDCAYLNTGSSGPPPDYVLEAMREADDLCSGPAYLEGVGLFVHQAETNSRAREAAARLVGSRRRGPHPEHHPRHEPRRRLDRLARRRRGRLGNDGAPGLPRAAPQPEEPLRGRGRPDLAPRDAGEDRSLPDAPDTPRRLIARGLDERRGTAAAGDLRRGPRAGSPHPGGRRPVGREHPGRRAGHRSGHVRFHRPQVGARPRRHRRFLRQAGPAGLQPERRFYVADRPDRLRHRGWLRAEIRRPPLRSLDHESRPRRRSRRRSGCRPRARRCVVRGDPAPRRCS